jgi:hypothetical protein
LLSLEASIMGHDKYIHCKINGLRKPLCNSIGTGFASKVLT